MKNIKLILIALMAFALTGCSDSSNDNPEPPGGGGSGSGSVVGQWHMISWSTLSTADVYLSFSDAGTFEVYQRVYTPQYVHFRGGYSYQDGTLSGQYSDNTAWGGSYSVSFNSDGTQMTLTRTASAGDVSVFVKAAIPDEIISSVEAAALQSRAAEETLRFL